MQSSCSCFSYTTRIKVDAVGLNSPLFSYQYTMYTSLCAAAYTDIYNISSLEYWEWYKTINLLLVIMLFHSLIQSYLECGLIAFLTIVLQL